MVRTGPKHARIACSAGISKQDKWTEAQVKKMTLGGNAKCAEFFKASGQYNKSNSIETVYNKHFAAQYRDKLAAECEGRSWDPSQTPEAVEAPAENTSGLRKPRSQNSRTASPAPRNIGNNSGSGNSTPIDGANPFAAEALGSNKAVVDQTYFAGLGQANASRPEGLRPSEGGKCVYLYLAY